MPLWNAATPGKPTCEPPMLEVDLSSMQSENTTTATPAFTSTLMPPLPAEDTEEPSRGMAEALHLQIKGALEWLQWPLHLALSPFSQCGMPKRDLPLAALGVLPPVREIEDSPEPERMVPVLSAQMAPLMLASLPVTMPGNTCISMQLPLQPIALQAMWVASIAVFPLRTVTTQWSDNLLSLQGEITVALEQLLTNRATRDLHHKE